MGHSHEWVGPPPGCVAMTQSYLQLRNLLLAAAVCTGGLAWTQPDEVSYQVGTEPPRLLLRPQRLRLLQRERQRQSMRWEQFDALMRGQAQLPEPGLALALYYRVSGEAEAGRRAVAWALTEGADLRQQALVLDWCQPLLEPAERRRLVSRLEKGLGGSADGESVSAACARVLAAIALADDRPKLSAAQLEAVVQRWWRGKVVAGLRQGRAVARADHYPLFEMLHALRDNLQLDLREDARWFFKDLPVYQLMSYYPASYPAAENEYRIPASRAAEPDLIEAMMSRAAEMAMVAYEPNAQETQFLQGWIMQDRYLMRHPRGITYEFLWANPYHPGLTYHSLPLVYHDEKFGRLFLRSSWEEDADWLGCFDGQIQSFSSGRPRRLQPGSGPAAVRVGQATVLIAASKLRFAVSEGGGPVFIVGLKPDQAYDVEVDDEQMREQRTDRGGILALPEGTRGGIRLKESPGAARR